MKKKWLVSLVVCVYAIAALFFYVGFVAKKPIVGEGINWFLIAVCVLLAIWFILVIINIVCAVNTYSNKLLPASSPDSFGFIMAIKLSLIPYYVSALVIWVLVAIVSLNPFIFFFGGGIIVGVAILLVALFSYVTLLASSCHIIAHVAVLRQKGAINILQCVALMLLSLAYCADIVVAIYLYAKNKSGEFSVVD